jgi:hypothetical protein
LFSGIIVTDVGNDLAEKLFPETTRRVWC